MSEDAWAARKECEEERGEIEVKLMTSSRHAAEFCGICEEPAVWEFEVGLVASPRGVKIPLCESHGDEDHAFDFYKSTQNQD